MLKFVIHKIFQLKRIFLAVTAIILSATTVIHPFSSTGIKDSTPPNFALVLSGGGARGLAQIGVLLALEHAGLKPDLIVGTSIGALIGGLFSAGYSPDSIKTMAHTIRWEDIANNDINRHSKFVSQKTEPLNHIIEFRFTKKFKPILPSQSYGQYFYEVLTPKFALPQIKSKGNFDSLKIPLRVIATDLLTGKKYVFSKGNIATSIRASCSIPLIFSPVEYEGHLFIDGGISSNIPVECAIDNNAKHIVAVDVTAPLWNKVDLDNPVKMVDQVIAIGVTRQKNYEKSLADILICPNLNNFSNTDYRNIDTLISIGYYATLEKIDSIKLLIAPEKQLLESVHDQNGQDSSDTSSISKTSKGTVTHYQYNNSQIHDTTIFQPGIVKDVLITGNIGTYPRIIKTAAGIKAGDTLSPLLFEKSLSSLYATDLFELINTEIDSDFTVKISVKEKMHWRTRIGLRYDNFHLAEGFIQPAYENLFGLGITALLHLQYGMAREKYAFELQTNPLITANISYNINLQLYSTKERIIRREIMVSENLLEPDEIDLNEKTLRKSGLIGLIGTQIGKWSLLSGGLRVEKYKLQTSDISALNDVMGLKFHDVFTYLMLNFLIDTMDKFPIPTTGIKHYVSIGTTGRVFGEKNNLIKINGSLGRYFTIKGRHTFFPQLRACWSNDTLPEVEQVYLGGISPEPRYRDINVYNYIPFIGLPPLSMPGDIMGLAHFEYRLSITKTFYTYFLADWGYIWDREKNQASNAAKEFLQKAPIGLGVSIVYETPVGPLRFTYGQLLPDHLVGNDISSLGLNSKPQFYFSAGRDF